MDNGIEGKGSVCMSPTQASFTSAGVPKGIDETHMGSRGVLKSHNSTVRNLRENQHKQSSSPEAVCVPLKLPAPRIILPVSYGLCFTPMLVRAWNGHGHPFPLFSTISFRECPTPEQRVRFLASIYIDVRSTRNAASGATMIEK